MKKPKARRIYTSEDLGVDATTNLVIVLELHRRAISAGIRDSDHTHDGLLEYQTIVLRAEDIKASHAATNKSMLNLLEDGG